MARAGTEVGDRLRIERTVEASPERVFRAWTEAEGLKQWHAPGDTVVELAEVDLRVGGRWRVHMRGADGTPYRVSGEYREIDAPHRLVYTWQWEHEPGVESVVTVEFVAREGGTSVTLTHDGLQDEASRSGHGTGWEACLDKLQSVI